MPLPAPFNAFRIHQDEHGHRSGIEAIGLDQLNPGEVVIRAQWSSVNYKDALAGTGKGRILRRFPLVGGIDVAGTVVASTDPAYREGDAVLATGCGLSETRDGGYSQYVRLAASAVIAQPAGLTPREAMVLGTAGFTAALALLRMTDNRLTPSHGPLAVTGATGGVGSLAVDIFSLAGFEVHAISARPTRPTTFTGWAPARCCRARRWPRANRWNRRASAAAWTMPVAPCWPACWRRRCLTAAWSAPVWRPARRWT